MFIASAVLLLAFVVTESRVKSPLLPLRVLTERNRGGVYLSLGLAIIAMFGLFLFLTYYLQVVKGYSPVKTGFAFLPMIAGMITGSTQIGTRLMTRVPPRLLMGPGFLVAAVGMLLLTQLDLGTSYAAVILPGMLLLGLGMGTAFMLTMSLATHGIEPRDAGVASAMVNTSQQVGGAIGTALLNTIAASATTAYVADHAARATDPRLLELQAMVSGFAAAIWWAVGILVAAAAIAFTLINTGRPGTGAVAGSGSGTADGVSGEDAEEEYRIPVIAHCRAGDGRARPSPAGSAGAAPLPWLRSVIRRPGSGRETPRLRPGQPGDRSAEPGQIRVRALRLQAGGERLHDLPEALHLLRREPVEHCLPYGLDVPRRRAAEHRVTVVGEHRVLAALVGGAVLAAHPAVLLQPGDGVGEPGPGDLRVPGQLRHPHPAAGGLRELDEQPVVGVRHSGVTLQLAVEMVLQERGGMQIGAPGVLLLVGEPARRAGGCRGHVLHCTTFS